MARIGENSAEQRERRQADAEPEDLSSVCRTSFTLSSSTAAAHSHPSNNRQRRPWHEIVQRSCPNCSTGSRTTLRHRARGGNCVLLASRKFWFLVHRAIFVALAYDAFVYLLMHFFALPLSAVPSVIHR
jgi:hypothetical protein